VEVFNELVLPAKVFEIKEEASVESIVGKLKDFREEEPYHLENGDTTNLVTEVLDLKLEEGVISGVLSKDFVRRRFYRRKLVETPVTEESPFWIKPFRNKAFMIVLAPSVARGVKKLLTNYVANKLSNVLFISSHAVVEVRYPWCREALLSRFRSCGHGAVPRLSGTWRDMVCCL